MIEQLPILMPDPRRRQRTLARCHQRLVRQARPRARRRIVVERTLFLGFSAAYLSSLAFNVARVLIR